MRQLTLLRHAQAEPQSGEGHDIDRALSLHGRSQAGALGALLHTEDAAPHLVLCSAANRAVQTWKLLAAGLAGAGGQDGTGIECRQLEELYGAGPTELLDLVRQVPAETTSVLVIGHEPVISHVASILAGPRSQPAATAQVRAGMSTAMAAFLRTESPWSELARGQATLTGLIRPDVKS